MQELFDMWTGQSSVEFEDVTNLFVQVGLLFDINDLLVANALSVGRLHLVSYVRPVCSISYDKWSDF
jgi:hypothetical protein